jgi:hypothetical protein
MSCPGRVIGTLWECPPCFSFAARFCSKLLLGSQGRLARARDALEAAHLRVLVVNLGARDCLPAGGNVSMLEISVSQFQFLEDVPHLRQVEFRRFMDHIFRVSARLLLLMGVAAGTVGCSLEVEDFPRKRWETALPNKIIPYRLR